MFLTTKARYAVMAILDIMQKKGKTVSIKVMAERQNLSACYLEQLFSSLKKQGIVHSIKGPGGGYTLNRDPSSLSLLEILNAVGENIKITKCGRGEVCRVPIGQAKCSAHYLWKDLGKYLEKYFAATSLSDIEKNNFFYERFLEENKPPLNLQRFFSESNEDFLKEEAKRRSFHLKEEDFAFKKRNLERKKQSLILENGNLIMEKKVMKQTVMENETLYAESKSAPVKDKTLLPENESLLLKNACPEDRNFSLNDNKY